MKFSKVELRTNGTTKVYGGDCGECRAPFLLGADTRFPQIQCPSCGAITHIDYMGVDTRLIIRPNRRFKLRTMGANTVYHVRAIIDDERVVVKSYDFTKRQWDYDVFQMSEIEQWYRDGRIS